MTFIPQIQISSRGAGQTHLLGVYMQRWWIISLVTSSILFPIYIFAVPVLKFLGQQKDVADPAGSFTLLVIPQIL
ncbi:MATE family efflux protein [Medicago truncatula]|uniref:MATE family efflux protein n=1 Tax=Medicago truncatula TaxID=3880 RepID=G7JGU2_MEDTR|nr:MATE family efflux protein [Medicago truncatula]